MASVVSESDIAIFQALSNPAVTFPVTGPVPSRSSPSRFQEEERAGSSDRGSDNDGAASVRRDDFDDNGSADGYDAIQELYDGDRRDGASSPSPARSAGSANSPFRQAVEAVVDSRAGSVASSRRSTPRNGARYATRNETPPRVHSERGSGNIFGSINQRSGGGASAFSGGGAHSYSADDMISKQQALLEIERLRTQGATITRSYTIHDRLEDIEFEVRRHQMHMEEQVTLTMMKDMLKIAFGGIEMANNRLGPWLDLDGWSASMTADLSKYDSALSRIYRKHARKSSMSPESELALGVLSSLGVHHCRKKFSKNLASEMGFDSRRTMPKPAAHRQFASSMSVQEEDDEEGLPPP